MIIVTGGAGMIGSNLVRQLNLRGITDIVVVDNLRNGRKMFNLADLDIADYLSKSEFIRRVEADQLPKNTQAVFHLGADSATTQWDGEYLMDNNYQYSKTLLHWCQANQVSFFYASSASVYGLGEHGFCEGRRQELPINMYAYSKFQFDHYVRQLLPGSASQIVGLRYFNVYGPREGHKGSMASAAYHFYQQALESGKIKLFAGTEGIADGQQQRDFVYVEDCALANLWFLDNPHCSGIFNVGSGRASSFNQLAEHIIAELGSGEISYIPFPDGLRGSYQNYTQADLTALRAVGCDIAFRTVAEGVKEYLQWARSSPLFV